MVDGSGPGSEDTVLQIQVPVDGVRRSSRPSGYKDDGAELLSKTSPEPPVIGGLLHSLP